MTLLWEPENRWMRVSKILQHGNESAAVQTTRRYCTSLAVEGILAAPVRIDSPFGVWRNAADDQLVEWLRRADLRQQCNNECNEEGEATDKHNHVLLWQSVPRHLARYLGMIRYEADDGKRAADEQYDDCRQEDHVENQIARGYYWKSTTANLHTYTYTHSAIAKK